MWMHVCEFCFAINKSYEENTVVAKKKKKSLGNVMLNSLIVSIPNLTSQSHYFHFLWLL